MAKRTRGWDVRRIYCRFRVGLMAFALGLAGVYMADGLGVRSGEVWVDLPAARSGDVLHVFVDNSRLLTREKNCGLDPADAQARSACSDQRLYGSRDLRLYTHFEVVCSSDKPSHALTLCGPAEAESKRDFIWQHWRNKTRAHLIVRYEYFGGQDSESHYFIEPYAKDRWHLASQHRRPRSYFIGDEWINVPSIEDDYPWTYETPRWKTVTEDDALYYHLPPGTRFLQFENLTGDTVSF